MELLRKKNYYERLNVPRTADTSRIKQAYRELAAVFHPDSNLYEKNKNALTRQHLEVFKLLTEAYNTLVDEKLREKYDKSLSTYIKTWEDKDPYIRDIWKDKLEKWVRGDFTVSEKAELDKENELKLQPHVDVKGFAQAAILLQEVVGQTTVKEKHVEEIIPSIAPIIENAKTLPWRLILLGSSLGVCVSAAVLSILMLL